MRPSTRPPEVRFASSRIELRPPASSDIDDLVAELNDFAVSRMLARVPYPYGRTDAKGFLGRARGGADRDIALMITLDDRVIGAAGLGRTGGDASEFGYWLGRAHWGLGYASEAGRAFLSHVFDTAAAETVRSGVFVDNPASLRVQKKLGFIETGKRFVECLARGSRVEHIDTVLTRARFVEAAP